MPVTLAILAIDRSISAQRMTKVSPTAMMPVTETWVRMLPTLSMVAKEGLAIAKKADSKISVRNGAMLRICERSSAAIPLDPLRSPEGTALSLLTISRSSGCFQQAVLADFFVGELAHDRAALEHDDAIGERQHRLRLGREHDDGKPPFAQVPNDVDDVVLGTDIHAAGRLAQDQHARREGQPFGERDFLLVAAGEHAEVELDGRRSDLQLLDLPHRDLALAQRLQPQGRNAVENADRDVLVDRLLVE